MKVADIIKAAENSLKQEGCDFIDEFSEDLGVEGFIGWSAEFGVRVKYVNINTWICTDTEVGLRLFYFDENPIAFMWQSARRSGKNITWVNAHSRKEVRDFIISINEDRNPEEYTSIMDIDKDVPEFWLKNPYE